MPKTKEPTEPAKADKGVKVNYTPSELDEILAAVARAGEYKTATWARKVTLQVARGELVAVDRKGRR